MPGEGTAIIPAGWHEATITVRTEALQSARKLPRPVAAHP
jgi:hypothetical protein